MGHGDTIVLADAHFPGHSVNSHTLRADGLKIPALLDAILPLFVLDDFIPDPVAMMAPVPGDSADPEVEACVVAIFRSMLFPKPNGGLVQVRYPLEFRPAAAPDAASPAPTSPAGTKPNEGPK